MYSQSVIYSVLWISMAIPSCSKICLFNLIRILIALLNYIHRHTKTLGCSVGPKTLPLKWLLLHFPLLCGPYTTPQVPGGQWVSKWEERPVTRPAAGYPWWPVDLLGTRTILGTKEDTREGHIPGTIRAEASVVPRGVGRHYTVKQHKKQVGNKTIKEMNKIFQQWRLW